MRPRLAAQVVDTGETNVAEDTLGEPTPRIRFLRPRQRDDAVAAMTRPAPTPPVRRVHAVSSATGAQLKMEVAPP